MRFRGNAKELKTFFDTLIAVFGEDAKVKNIESRVKTMRGAERWGYISQ